MAPKVFLELVTLRLFWNKDTFRFLELGPGAMLSFPFANLYITKLYDLDLVLYLEEKIRSLSPLSNTFLLPKFQKIQKPTKMILNPVDKKNLKIWGKEYQKVHTTKA